MAFLKEKKHFLPTGIFRSLKVAFKNLFRPHITIQYPKERAHIPERARFAVEISYAQDGSHRCQACRICEGACPDHLIRLELEQREDKTKHIDHWYYRRGACMMCGLCVEACPFDAIHMGHDYELAHADPSLLTLDLLTDTPAYQRPRPAPRAAEAASASAPAASAQCPEPPREQREQKKPVDQPNQKEASDA